jgi:hypothetical protein
MSLFLASRRGLLQIAWLLNILMVSAVGIVRSRTKAMEFSLV